MPRSGLVPRGEGREGGGLVCWFSQSNDSVGDSIPEDVAIDYLISIILEGSIYLINLWVKVYILFIYTYMI